MSSTSPILQGGALEEYAKRVTEWAQQIANGAAELTLLSRESGDSKPPTEQELMYYNKDRIKQALASKERCSLSKGSSREQAHADNFLLEAYFMWNENELNRNLIKSGNISAHEGNKKLAHDYLLPLCNSEVEQREIHECEIRVKSLETFLEKERLDNEKDSSALRVEINTLREKSEKLLNDVLEHKSGAEVSRKEISALSAALSEAKETILKYVTQIESQKALNLDLKSRLEELKEKQAHQMMVLSQKDKSVELALREECQRTLDTVEHNYTRKLQNIADEQAVAEAAALRYKEMYEILQQSLSDLEAAHKEEIERIKSDQSEESKKEKEETKITISRIEKSFAFQSKQLQDQLDRAEEIKLQLEDKIKNLKSKESQAEKMFVEKFTAVSDAHERKLLALSNHHEREITVLKTAHAQQLESLTIASNAASDKQRAQIASHVSKIKQLQEAFEQLESELMLQNQKNLQLAKEKDEQRRRAESGHAGLQRVHDKLVKNSSIEEIQKSILNSIYEVSMTSDQHKKFLQYAQTPRPLGTSVENNNRL